MLRQEFKLLAIVSSKTLSCSGAHYCFLRYDDTSHFHSLYMSTTYTYSAHTPAACTHVTYYTGAEFPLRGLLCQVCSVILVCSGPIYSGLIPHILNNGFRKWTCVSDDCDIALQLWEIRQVRFSCLTCLWVLVSGAFSPWHLVLP